jgi:putative redox protein
MVFEILQDGHSLVLDADPDSGGSDTGARPKGLLLSGLIGCTGMDVVSILRKMRVEGYGLELEAEADLTDSYPVVFSRIRLRYLFSGRDLPRDRIEHAVRLSQEKYCGVSAMLRMATPLEWEIVYREG